ncbi:hypothetical protein BHE74_00007190 [Ensete ventricosum]|nr:hypothetical protein BHE74_00007190 [Ensete ventricosum]RZR94317.1 hypothetical protein BHM03_00022980 [Ensete ventricosum]
MQDLLTHFPRSANKLTLKSHHMHELGNLTSDSTNLLMPLRNNKKLQPAQTSLIVQAYDSSSASGKNAHTKDSLVLGRGVDMEYRGSKRRPRLVGEQRVSVKGEKGRRVTWIALLLYAPAHSHLIPLKPLKDALLLRDMESEFASEEILLVIPFESPGESFIVG